MTSIPVSGARVAKEAVVADRFATERRLAGLNILVAFIALAIGGSMGLLQVLAFNKINVYPYLAPFINSYYQGLTIHGVLNVLVFTTFFIVGFLTLIAARSYDRPLANPRLAWATFYVMVVGLVLAAIPLLTNRATVLFTFYPPLRADSLFYIGLTLVVVGTWLLTLNLILTNQKWHAENLNQRTPLAAFMAMVTMIMWTISTIGLASEMLFLIIPWSLGLVPGTEPILARTLFWFTGHPIVYFWLLPAYVSWYNLVPRQAGGKLFSDPMARVSFLLFLILSVPIGIHHQVTDPGISQAWKFVHAFFTFAVFFPSLLTFFNVIASLESGGRARGGKGWLGWILHLPWSDPSLSVQLLAMILFAFGGIGGLINASYNVNLVIHNTAWVPGHFHLTVGSAVALTFMGVAYWLVPHLTGRMLWSRWLGVVQGWLWFGGMAVFSHWMHLLGLAGMPRRTMIGAAPYLQPQWEAMLPLVAFGGVIMFISAFCFYLNLVMTIFAGKPKEQPVIPFAKAISSSEDAPLFLDRLRPWIVLTFVLIIINYGPTIYQILSNATFSASGLRPW